MIDNIRGSMHSDTYTMRYFSLHCNVNDVPVPSIYVKCGNLSIYQQLIYVKKKLEKIILMIDHW